MSTHTSRQYQSGGTTDGVHHSKEDALNDREFELLLEGAQRLDGGYFSLEAQFIILIAGRLGLRSGEICHMRESWIDRRRRMIVIPAFQACEKGQNGGICGTCKQAARQRVEHNEELTLDDALAETWSPKTDAAAREVPFDATPRAELIVERYFDRFDRFQTSQTGINRRVTHAAEAADELSGCDARPHGLRATAASRFAARGLDVIPSSPCSAGHS